MAMTGHYDEARSSMAEAREGLAGLQLGEIAAYLALLDALAETLAGDPASAERAVLEAEAIVSASGDRWYLSLIYVDLAHAILAQHRLPEGHRGGRPDRDTAGALRCRVGDQASHRASARGGASGRARTWSEGARAAVAAADATGLIVCRANAHRTLAELLWATGRTHAAAIAARRALALDDTKANAVAAATTRERFSRLLGPLETGRGSGP
jgi:hypothetical protein